MMKATLLFLSGLLLIFTASSCDSEARKEKKLMDMFNQGIEYYQQGEYQKAHDCFDKCIKIDSTWVEFYENRGSMKIRLSDWEGSKKDFEKGLSMDSCSKFSLLGLADYNDKHNDHQKAVHYYEKLITCDSTVYFSYINYGISCYEAKDYNKALFLFFKCIELTKENPDPFRFIGLIFQQQGDSVAGEIFLNKAMKIEKTSKDIDRVINYNIE